MNDFSCNCYPCPAEAEVERLQRVLQDADAELEAEREARPKLEAEVERLRVSEAEAWEKSGAWHKLLQGQVCVYCREPLLSGAGPPCQHQKQLQRASLAHSKAEGAVAEVERLRAALGRIVYRAKDLNEAEEIAYAALAEEEA